jgi:hypothetical protein
VLFIADKRLPQEAKKNLKNFGNILELYVSGVTYEAIAGHPDIFFCRAGAKLITAPNLPEEYRGILSMNNIEILNGKTNVGKKYPLSAVYNAVVTENYLLHKLSITDEVILDNTAGIKRINIKQGYCRCSLLPLKENHFITSDKGILKTLSEEKINALYIPPEEIILPGFSHGFIGGAFGVYEDKVFIAGRLKYLSEDRKLKDYLLQLNYEIIELYDGPLFDGGSIIIL